MTKCPDCGKENPAEIHTCTPLALRLADELDADSNIIGYDKHAAELRRLHTENEALKTVMVAAAEEIHEHWQAHCDAEGYGPANLMRRLEEGIPSQYGYTAGRFAELQAENEALRDALQALYDTAPYAECSDFHHAKKDRHEVTAHCPVLARYEEACLKARSALARAGETK